MKEEGVGKEGRRLFFIFFSCYLRGAATKEESSLSLATFRQPQPTRQQTTTRLLRSPPRPKKQRRPRPRRRQRQRRRSKSSGCIRRRRRRRWPPRRPPRSCRRRRRSIRRCCCSRLQPKRKRTTSLRCSFGVMKVEKNGRKIVRPFFFDGSKGRRKCGWRRSLALFFSFSLSLLFSYHQPLFQPLFQLL